MAGTRSAGLAMQEVRTVPVGAGPHLHLGYLKEHGQVWVSNTGGDEISILDELSGEPVGRVACGPGPAHFVFDGGCQVGFVALSDGDAVAVVDPRRGEVLGRVELAAGANPVALMPAFDRARVYSLNAGDGTVSAIDTEGVRVATTIPVGREPAWGQPWGSSYKPITRPVGKSYIANPASDDVTIFDDATDTVLSTVAVGRRPVRNAIFREKGLIYFANELDGTLSALRIADDRLVATVPVGVRPFRMLPVEAICGRDELWVLNAGSDEAPEGVVSFVSGERQQVVGTLALPDRPANWVVNPAGVLFVVSASSREMALVDIAAAAQVGEGRLSRDPQLGAISGLVQTKAGTLFVLNSDATVSIFRAAS